MLGVGGGMCFIVGEVLKGRNSAGLDFVYLRMYG